jgi:hypothetical protein
MGGHRPLPEPFFRLQDRDIVEQRQRGSPARVTRTPARNEIICVSEILTAWQRAPRFIEPRPRGR